MPDTGVIKTSLETIKNQWANFKQFESQISSAIGSPTSYTKIEEFISLINEAEEEIRLSNDYDLLRWVVVKQDVERALNGVISNFQQRANNPGQLMAVMIPQLSSLYAAYDMMLTIAPLRSNLLTVGNREKKAFSSQVKWLRDKLLTTEESIKNLNIAEKTIISNKHRGDEIIVRMAKELDNIEKAYQEILGHERNTANAKINSEENASKVAGEYDNIVKLKLEMIAKKNDLDLLYKHMEEKQDELERLLKLGAMLGMGSAFQKRSAELKVAGRWWFGFFLAGLAALALSGSYLAVNLVTSKVYSINSIARLFIVSPCIWWAWFTARQYGRTSRLQEDYAFKGASAMAYIGYRDEMNKNDDELLSYLQKSAIRTFSENPAKINDLNTDPASPLHDVIQKVNLKELNEVLSKLLVLLKLK